MRIFSIALVLGAVVAILLWCGWAELREAVTRVWLRVPSLPSFPSRVTDLETWQRANPPHFDDPPHWAESDHFACGDK